ASVWRAVSVGDLSGLSELARQERAGRRRGVEREREREREASGEGERELLQAPNGEAGAPHGLGVDEAEAGEAAGEGAEGDAGLEAGQGGAETEVGAATEAHVRVRVAAEVEAVGVGEHRRVSVGSSGQAHDDAAGGNLAIADANGVEGDALDHLDG